MYLIVQFTGRELYSPQYKKPSPPQKVIDYTVTFFFTVSVNLMVAGNLFRTCLCCTTFNYIIAIRKVRKGDCLFIPVGCVLINKAFILKCIISIFIILIILNSLTTSYYSPGQRKRFLTTFFKLFNSQIIYCLSISTYRVSKGSKCLVWQ